jgi:hypothetical protein
MATKSQPKKWSRAPRSKADEQNPAAVMRSSARDEAETQTKSSERGCCQNEAPVGKRPQMRGDKIDGGRTNPGAGPAVGRGDRMREKPNRME